MVLVENFKGVECIDCFDIINIKTDGAYTCPICNNNYYCRDCIDDHECIDITPDYDIEGIDYYRCGECGEIYENPEEAEECCQEEE